MILIIPRLQMCKPQCDIKSNEANEREIREALSEYIQELISQPKAEGDGEQIPQSRKD